MQNEVDAKYKTACYILSIPIIFNRVGKDLEYFETPIDWIYSYLEKGNPRGYELNEKIIQLGKLSLNLWDGYSNFNLVNCMAVLDDMYFEVFKKAIEMRREYVEVLRLEEFLTDDRELHMNGKRIPIESIQKAIDVITEMRKRKNPLK